MKSAIMNQASVADIHLLPGKSLTAEEKTTSMNIKPIVIIVPKTAILGSVRNPRTIATAAATPANPRANLTAGTALIASLSNCIGAVTSDLFGRIVSAGGRGCFETAADFSFFCDVP